MPISKEVAEELITPYIPTVIKIFKDALRELNDKHFDPTFLTSTNSHILNNLITKHARINLSGNIDFKFRLKSGCWYMIFRDMFLVKFKKLDKNLLTSNIKTHSISKFLKQDIVLEWPDMPPVITNIVFGYQWSKVLKNYAGLYVTCPWDTQNYWKMNIEAPAENIIPLIVPATSTTTTAPKKKRFTVKRGIEDEKSVIDK